jgi:hypothetical protein
MKRAVLILTALTATLVAQDLKLPNHKDSLHFALSGIPEPGERTV